MIRNDLHFSVSLSAFTQKENNQFIVRLATNCIFLGFIFL